MHTYVPPKINMIIESGICKSPKLEPSQMSTNSQTDELWHVYKVCLCTTMTVNTVSLHATVQVNLKHNV